MAHSNREALKEARGGRTKNQDMKFKRKNRYQSNFNAEARMIELKKWSEERQSKTEQKIDPTQKRRHYSMLRDAQKRRRKVIASITTRLVYEVREQSIVRLTKELKTLHSRVIDLV